MTIHNFPTHGLKDKRYHLAYQYLMEKQGGTCLICARHQEEYRRKFHIDHCHKTGKIRGLLCEPCNHLLADIENMGDEKTLTINMSLQQINTYLRESFNLRMEMHPTFKKRVENKKIMLLQFEEENYNTFKKSRNEWANKHRSAIVNYLSLPGLNEEIEAYCNQFMRPRPTAK